MEAFELLEVLAERERSQKPYREFLRVPALSLGVYVLPAGGVDPQKPHTEDEVYYVAAGEARVTVGDEERPVRTGSVVFVPAGVEHRFHDIAAELVLLVVFAPAEYSRAGQAAPGRD